MRKILATIMAAVMLTLACSGGEQQVDESVIDEALAKVFVYEIAAAPENNASVAGLMQATAAGGIELYESDASISYAADATGCFWRQIADWILDDFELFSDGFNDSEDKRALDEAINQSRDEMNIPVGYECYIPGSEEDTV